VTGRFVDKDYLTGVQYASDTNLASRQASYRFQDPPVRNPVWSLDLARLCGDEYVLDVGCGNGVHLAELDRRGHRGKVFGVDLSPGMLSAAGSHARAALLLGDAQALPFPESSFDRVLAMHMLYHAPDRDRAIAEIRRVLRDEGVALVLTNSEHHLEELNGMVVDYVATMSWIIGTSDEVARPVLREVERRALAAIEADGAFRIRTDVGCFVCH
jgi:SAM-dependent methyltransferase